MNATVRNLDTVRFASRIFGVLTNRGAYPGGGSQRRFAPNFAESKTVVGGGRPSVLLGWVCSCRLSGHPIHDMGNTL